MTAPKVSLSKSEFALRRGVTPARVSQWIAEKKISGDAIVGDGRHARIDEEIACQQLDESLGLAQRSSNGRFTSLAVAMPLDYDTSLDVGRIITRTVDGILPHLAAAIAADFRHPPREVHEKMRAAWRGFISARRAEAAHSATQLGSASHG